MIVAYNMGFFDQCELSGKCIFVSTPQTDCPRLQYHDHKNNFAFFADYFVGHFEYTVELILQLYFNVDREWKQSRNAFSIGLQQRQYMY